MKKTKLLAAVLGIVLAVSALTACSTAAVIAGDTSSATATTTPEADESASSADTDTSTGTATFANVSEYLADPDVAAAMGELEAAMEGTGMNATITADGNTLVYTYRFEVAVDADAAERLAEGLEDQAATFESVAASLRALVNADDVAVRVTYLDEQGSELYSRDFS